MDIWDFFPFFSPEVGYLGLALVSFLGYEAGLLIISVIFICVLLIAIPRSRPVIERMEAPPPPELI